MIDVDIRSDHPITVNASDCCGWTASNVPDCCGTNIYQRNPTVSSTFYKYDYNDPSEWTIKMPESFATNKTDLSPYLKIDEEDILEASNIIRKTLEDAEKELEEEQMKEKKEEKKEEKKADLRYAMTFKPVKIINNGPATIVFWKDGTKTVVMRSKDEVHNPYTAFCAALAKKIFLTNSEVNRIVKKTIADDKGAKEKKEEQK